MIDRARDERVMASFLAVRPNYSFHVVSMDDDDRVAEMRDVTRSDIWINGGYFVLRRDFLDQLRPGEELVEEPLQRLFAAGKVLAQRHEGFWAPMDTLKDQQWLESLHEDGNAPWQLWDPGPAAPRVLGAGELGMMLPLLLGRPEAAPVRALAIGAHPDDVEIGCGGTILKLIEESAISEFRWVVLSGEGERSQRGAPKRRGAARAGAGQRGGDLRLPRRLLPVRGQADQGVLRGV